MKSTGSSLIPALVAVAAADEVDVVVISVDEDVVTTVVTTVAASAADEVAATEGVATLVKDNSTSTTKRPSRPWVRAEALHVITGSKIQPFPTPSLSWLFRVSMYAFELLYGVSCQPMHYARSLVSHAPSLHFQTR